MGRWPGMVERRDYGRGEVEELLLAIERQAQEAVTLAERAQRDMRADRFAPFLDFRTKVEEVRALVTLTEQRLAGLDGDRLADLGTEFERIDLLLIALLARSLCRCFATLREDQILPMGAREMFEPELPILAELRAKLDRPQYAGRVPPGVIEDLDEAAALITRTIRRAAPALPDFSGAPTPPKPMKRLPKLGGLIHV